MKRYRIAYWLAMFTFVVTLVLITWGGIVHATGSSLACPDWPTCLGQIMPDTSELPPDQRAGIFWEHGHRTLGTIVGLCAIALVVLMWRPHPTRGSARWSAVALLLLIIAQGLLGAITVLLRINIVVTVFHLGISMIVLAGFAYLARKVWLLSRPQSLSVAPTWDADLARRTLPLAIITLALVFIQIILGGVVRHTDAWYAAGMGPQAAMLPLDPLTGQPSLWPGETLALLNAIHRYLGLIVLLALFVFSGVVWSRLGERMSGKWILATILPPALVVLQVLIGIGMIAMHFPLYMRAAHLAGGALTLAATFLVVVEIARNARSIALTEEASQPASPPPPADADHAHA